MAHKKRKIESFKGIIKKSIMKCKNGLNVKKKGMIAKV